MFIVLLETSGNQRYIFSTNKLRENVGASELTYQIGTSVVKKYVDEINKANNNDAIKPIITTSGKSLLLVSGNDDSTAKKLVSKVTQHALENMAGLTINGAICKVTDATDAKSLHEAVGDVHKRLEEIRYQIPSNLQRFQRIPFVAECASSNLPASGLFKHPNLPNTEKEKPHSLVSITKQLKSNEGKIRLENEVKKYEADLHFADNINALDKKFEDTKWLAIIHADGNGLGQIFLDFKEQVDAKSGKDYQEKYHKFSKGLDECTTKAAAFALKEMRDKIGNTSIEVPAIPLVLGGDDLTIICDGQYAIKFTKDFLNKFVEETKTNPKIIEVFTIDGKPKEISLGICAGIAIIKPHFPFHQAYDLAAELLQSAKKSKKISTSLSAFDYHVLYDSSGTTLEEIREKTPFVARPYIVTDIETAKGFVDVDNEENQKKSVSQKADEKTWIENHHFDQLKTRVNTMIEPEEGEEKRKLPNSQMHVLREGLFVAETTLDIQQEVDARAKLIAHRYEKEGFGKLFAKDKSLFFDAVLFDKIEGETETKRTHFLDALDIVEFWK